MPNPGPNARSERLREFLILAGFLVIAAMAVVTVLLPETQNQKEPGEGGGASAGATPAVRN
ncbi:MAG TPA: hypothetical protein VF331_24965 [Polyangiales bacterium]